MKDENPENAARRAFLKGAAVASVGAVAVGSAAHVLHHDYTELDNTPNSKTKGYHETPHIHDYYKSL